MRVKAVRWSLPLFLVLLAASASPQQSDSDLFLGPNDIPRMSRIVPRLAEASNKGPAETHAFLASQELSYVKVEQVLKNVAVAYTAIRLEEYLKQVEPLLDEKKKDSQYQGYVTQARKQLADLTAKYEQARKDGRSALEINKEYVLKNKESVEEIMVHIHNVKLESLPRMTGATRQ